MKGFRDKLKSYSSKVNFLTKMNKNKLVGASLGASSLMLMGIPAGAEAYSYSVTTETSNIVTLLSSLITFVQSNQLLAMLFTMCLIGVGFGLIKKAKRAVK